MTFEGPIKREECYFRLKSKKEIKPLPFKKLSRGLSYSSYQAFRRNIGACSRLSVVFEVGLRLTLRSSWRVVNNLWWYQIAGKEQVRKVSRSVFESTPTQTLHLLSTGGVFPSLECKRPINIPLCNLSVPFLSTWPSKRW